MESNYLKTECEQDLVKCETLYDRIHTYIVGLGVEPISKQKISPLLKQAFGDLPVYRKKLKNSHKDVRIRFFKCLKERTDGYSDEQRNAHPFKPTDFLNIVFIEDQV